MKAYYCLKRSDGTVDVELERAGPRAVSLAMGDVRASLEVAQVAPGEFLVLSADPGSCYAVHDLLLSGSPDALVVSSRAGDCLVSLLDEHQVAMAERAGYGAHRSDGVIAVCAPMPGKVVKALVEEGQAVKDGQGVIVVEAMKMENELRSPVAGTIKRVLAGQGESVDAGQQLVIIE